VASSSLFLADSAEARGLKVGREEEKGKKRTENDCTTFHYHAPADARRRGSEEKKRKKIKPADLSCHSAAVKGTVGKKEK